MEHKADVVYLNVETDKGNEPLWAGQKHLR